MKKSQTRKPDAYGIEVRLIQNGKIIDKRKVKVKRFDARKVFRSVTILVECLR